MAFSAVWELDKTTQVRSEINIRWATIAEQHVRSLKTFRKGSFHAQFFQVWLQVAPCAASGMQLAKV